VERLRPVDIEREFRRHGSFLLVDTDGRLTWWGGDGSKALEDLAKSLTGRHAEMANFLIAQAKGVRR